MTATWKREPSGNIVFDNGTELSSVFYQCYVQEVQTGRQTQFLQWKP